MATLKDHQQAMIDLLASGSGIPASASRLAHAMHDLIDYMWAYERGPLTSQEIKLALRDATTPGLNDKALADDIKALQVNSPAKWPTPAEQRGHKDVAEDLQDIVDSAIRAYELGTTAPVQCDHDWCPEFDNHGGPQAVCLKCGATR